MIEYREFKLSNGLRVIIHEDHSTPLAAVNLLYNVGSRDEDPGKTGFAHLFEHLMFGGSVNIPSYDEPLQRVGGENNAFTSPDITNYYIQLPSVNIETAFWLESDRMLGLSFNEKSLDVQRNVVVEEFKQRYLNQPYGDVWLKLRPLAYQVHPYRWPTIGKEISHIENANLGDVKSFFNRFYHPANVIMTITGDVKYDEIEELTRNWFGPIPGGKPYHRDLDKEPEQEKPRRLEITAPVPVNAIYKVYHMPGRLDKGYHAADFLSEILGNGKSSRLYVNLVKEKKIFNSIESYITGSDEPGLLTINGKLNDGSSILEGDMAIEELIGKFLKEGPTGRELEKVKNQAESGFAFNEVEILSKAMSLAYFANLGDPSLYNLEIEKIRKVTLEDLMETAGSVLKSENCSTLYYHAEKSGN